MFVSEKVIFLELHKTGCTQIRNVLNELLRGELVGKHNQASSDLFTKGRKFFGSIRDPWEWYISLWAYGCDKRGAVWSRATKSKNSEKWKRTYKDVEDAGAFSDWLYMMHDRKYWHDIGQGYAYSSVPDIAGLFTYRYLKLFCCKSGEIANIKGISTLNEIIEYEKENCFIDHFIRNENLESSLCRALKLSGIEISNDQKAKIMSMPNTNKSSRTKGRSFYYDNDLENLILEREKFIIEKFGYMASIKQN